MSGTVNHPKNQGEFFGKVLVVGLGMIGGSVAKALKSRGLAELYGADRRHGELSLGLSTGVIDHAVDLTADVVGEMDIILLATPVRAMEAVLGELRPLLKPHTLLTDVGSTKGSVVEAAKKVFGVVPENFVPGHPIAGAEKSGVLAANPSLFERHRIIVTPLPDSHPGMVDRLHRLWSAIGGEVVSMDVDHHDLVLASSSHLPHLLAYTLVDTLANSDQSQDVFRFAAGGFRDFTRIASSDPIMWRDVFIANKAATLKTLDSFIEHLTTMRGAIESEDGPAMFGVFTRAKSARDHFLRLMEERTMIPSSDVKAAEIEVMPASSIKGSINLPGDKSLSHRVIILAALANGVSHLKNLDLGNDVGVTVQVLRDMGVVIEKVGVNQLRVHGVGLKGLKAPIAPIDFQSSTISLYLMLPVLAGQDFVVHVTGSELLQRQSLTELFAVVQQMGKEVVASQPGRLPISLTPGAGRGQFQLSLSSQSARLRAAVLFAALYSDGDVALSVGPDGRNHTENLLMSFGHPVRLKGNALEVPGQPWLTPVDITIPADVSKTAWMVLLATLLPGSQLQIENALINPMRTEYLDVLKSAGAKIRELEMLRSDPETSVSLEVFYADLKAFDLSREQTFRLRDELPLLCIAAVYAQGVSRFAGLDQLEYFAEERIISLMEALSGLSVSWQRKGGCLEIIGGQPLGGELDSAGDYRLALSMLLFGCRTRGGVKVLDCRKLLQEFEEFEGVAATVGFHCTVTQ